MESTATHHPTYMPKHSWWIWGPIILLGALAIGVGIWYWWFEKTYTYKIYPQVVIDTISFSGRKTADVEAYIQEKNAYFTQAIFELHAGEKVATLSASDIGIGYDAQLASMQAYAVGRSGNMFSDIRQKLSMTPIAITPLLRWNSALVSYTITMLAESTDEPVEEALFTFSDGKVTAFKPSKQGKKINIQQAEQEFSTIAKSINKPTNRVKIVLPIEMISPMTTTDKVNTFGIKEKIGSGYSEYQGSIPGRIHNVALAASKLNGILIPPGKEFSINEVLGDISARTGYQAAYVIKDGRTVLGDGGGVCQVSTTLFRAALNSGLPITERHAHAYRVHYYEEAGYKPGIDATIFAPSVDFRFKNDTPASILVQTKVDAEIPSLTVDFYGTTDGRKVEISNHTVSGISAPPAPLYQDDPTLPAGQIRQVDWAAWGASAAFTYKVTDAQGNSMQDQVFKSFYRPWQAVYLRGTKTD